MLRTSWGAFVAWCALGVCVLRAAPPAVAQPPVRPTAPLAAPLPAFPAPVLSPEERVEKQLDERVTVDYKRRPLRACLEDLAAHAGTAIVLDERVAESGLDRDRPVTFTCRSMRVQAALAHILRPLALRMYVTSEGVTIEPTDSTDCGMPTRVYSLTDLLAGEDADDLGEAKSRREKIIQLLTRSIGPTTWSTAGGPAQASFFGDSLVVSQYRDAHQEIVAVLAALRQEAKLRKDWDGQAAISALLGGEASLQATPESPEHPRIRAALAERANWEWIEQPLDKVIEAIAARCKVNCYFDEERLSDLGIPRDTPVTLNYPNRTAADALQKVLRDLDLAYVIRNDAVLITELGCGERMTTRLYPVFDIVGEEGQSLANIEQLVRTVTSHVAVTTWDDVGGPGLVAPYRGRSLIVSQTGEVHAEIADLLAGLRRMPERKLTAQQRAAEAARPIRRTYFLAAAKDQPTPSAAEVAAVVRKLVAPEVWKDARCSLEPLPGRLLVVAPARTQRQVAALLAELQVLPPPVAQASATGRGAIDGPLPTSGM